MFEIFGADDSGMCGNKKEKGRKKRSKDIKFIIRTKIKLQRQVSHYSFVTEPGM
jgi:hypothetical protein